MFFFVTEVMKIYYQKKLLSLANNMVELYVGLCFRGLNSHSISKQNVTHTDNGWYKIQSQSNRGEYYSVNTNIGCCACPRGKDGSPCTPQAAVLIQYGEYSFNFISSSSPLARQKLAQIALGDCAIQNLGFYSYLHQESL